MKLVRSVFLLALVFSFLAIPVHAADSKPTHMMVAAGEVVDEDYFAAADTVTVSGTINGDAYVAGGMIIVDGTIHGDLFAAGGTVHIKGPISQDLRIVGGTVTIDSIVDGNVSVAGGSVYLTPAGTIGGSLLAAAGTLGLQGPIGKGATIAASSLTIASSIDGNVRATAEQLSLLNKAFVRGDFTYWSDKEASIADGFAVGGRVHWNQIPKSDQKIGFMSKDGIENASRTLTYIFVVSAFTSFILLYIGGLILLNLIPYFSARTLEIIKKRPADSFGTALLATIVAPVVLALLILTGIGIPVAIALIFIFFLFFLVSKIYAAFIIGNFTLSKLNNHTPSRPLSLLVGLLLYFVLYVLPVIGWITQFIVLMLASGAIILEKHAVYKQMRDKHLI